jgi:hypothetical protein
MIRMRLASLFFGVACLLAVAADARAQHSEFVFYRINLRGQLERRVLVVSRLVPRFEEADFLASDVVRNELEVLDYQKEKLDPLLDQCLSSVKKLKEELAEANSRRGDPTELVQQIRQLQDQTIKEFDEILLPHQLARLAEIRFRCQLRSLGLKRMLVRGALGRELLVNAATGEALNVKANRIAAELGEASLSLRVKTIDRLFAVLTDEQRKLLRNELETYYYGPDGNLEILRWQLAFEPPLKRSDVYDPYCGFRAAAAFEVAVDGTLKPLPVRVDKAKPLINVVLPLLKEDVIVNTLQITELQFELLEELEKTRRASLNEFDRDFQIAFESGTLADATARRQHLANLTERQVQLWRGLDEDLKNVLQPEQFELLKLLSTQLDFVRRGPVAALVDGALGRRLNVTDAQQASSQELINDTAKLEQDAYDELLSVLDETQRNDLKKRLGDPFASTPGGTTLLLVDFLSVR